MFTSHSSISVSRLVFVAALALVAACGGRAPSPAAPPPAAGDDVARTLARHYQESGGGNWSRLAVLDQRLGVALASMTGEMTLLSDLRDGRTRSHLVIGPVTSGEGFDGQVHWRLDAGGELVVEDSPQALALGKTSAWITRGGYFPSATGATYRWLGVRDEAGHRYAVVEAVPEGGVRVELWFDDQSGLLARTSLVQGLDTVVTRLEDYRPVEGGVRLPFRVTIDSGDPRNLVTLQVKTTRLVASAAPDAFDRPASRADHLAFAGGARETQVPFELHNNHIYIRAAVNGQEVRMLVDTGGLNILTEAAAKRLGLATSGAMAGRGAGEKQVDVGFSRAGSLEVGALKVRDPLFYIFNFDELLTIEDVRFDGLVGFELFHRFIVRIDYAAGVLHLIEPAAFTPPAGATAVPFVLEGRVPLVEGQIDGVAARFTIDTGSRASLTAASPFVAKHGLLARYKPRFETITGWGVGGPVRSHLVRFAEIKIGGASVRQVVGDLYTGEHGAFADPRSDANLGGGILRRFTVTFDYGKRRMYLEPNARLAEREVYDRSGLFLIRKGDAIEVAAVAAGSPAQKAGVRAKDLVREIDGIPVAARPLYDWRSHLRDRPAGTRVVLTVEQAGQRRALAFALAELVP
jgi:predicted aspartyl protease